jgi:hypothetical protein
MRLFFNHKKLFMKQVILPKKNPFINVSGIIVTALLPILLITSCTKKTNEIAATTSSEEVTVAKGSNLISSGGFIECDS